MNLFLLRLHQNEEIRKLTPEDENNSLRRLDRFRPSDLALRLQTTQFRLYLFFILIFNFNILFMVFGNLVNFIVKLNILKNLIFM